MKHVDTPQTRCKAGFARGDITPPVGIYHRMWGAAVHERATGIHRPLLATALWLQPRNEGAEKGQCVLAIDHCIVDGEDMQRIRQTVGRAVGIDSDRVQVALSHTHGSGWMSRSRAHFPGGDLIAPYLDAVCEKLTQLAIEAKQTSQDATIVYGQGKCNLARHRDLWDAEHRKFVVGFNPDGHADETLLVARVNNSQGVTLGTVVNYACHPTTLAWQNTAISPDYIGAMREVVEGTTKGPCLFLQGASGDLGPHEGFVGDWEVADRNGRVLGYAVLSTLEQLPPDGTRFVYTGPVVSGATIGTWENQPLDEEALRDQECWKSWNRTVELPYRHDLPTLEETQQAHAQWLAEEEKANQAGDSARARVCHALVEQMNRQMTRLRAIPAGKVYPYAVHLCRFGDALWLFLPGELYQVFQMELRRRFPRHPIVISTVTGDWQPGYLPVASSYGYGIYQDVIAAVGPGSLEVLLETVARELTSLTESVS